MYKYTTRAITYGMLFRVQNLISCFIREKPVVYTVYGNTDMYHLMKFHLYKVKTRKEKASAFGTLPIL